jgi:hypothetical protein
MPQQAPTPAGSLPLRVAASRGKGSKPSKPTPQKTTMFEITSIAAKDTFDVELLSPSDEPLKDAAGNPISVTVYGPGSKAYHRAVAERNQRLMARLKRKNKTTLTQEEQLAENAEFLATCTASFNGWGYQGKSDREAMIAAYSDHTIGFIADQISKAVVDWANFTSSSPKS